MGESLKTCLLCGSQKVGRIETEIRNNNSPETKVYGCRHCGVQFLYPQNTDDELVSYYSGEYRQEYTAKDYYDREKTDDFFRRSLPEARTRLGRVAAYLRGEDDIIEIGCAAGYFLSVIRPLVRYACGTEWDRQNAAYSRTIGFEVEANIEDFKRKFDKVFMFHVLEHVTKPIEFLRHIKKYINPGGMLFIEVPNNNDALLSKYEIQEFKNFYYQSAHLWYLDDLSLTRIISQAGFKPQILPIQRYDISNHIHWLKDRVSGGQSKYNDIFSAACNEEYRKGLVAAKRTDTLFAICTIDQAAD